MRRIFSVCLVFTWVSTLGAQTAVKTIEDGVLDKISLFVASLDRAADLVVTMKLFDASKADLGTGGAEGKEARQNEAKMIQNEGPRILAERFAASLEKGPSNPFACWRPVTPCRWVRWWSRARSTRSIRAAAPSGTSRGSARASRRSRSAAR